MIHCLFRPSKKFAPFYGSRKGSFNYTGMPGDDEEEDYAEAGSRQFVINDNEVSWCKMREGVKMGVICPGPQLKLGHNPLTYCTPSEKIDARGSQ